MNGFRHIFTCLTVSLSLIALQSCDRQLPSTVSHLPVVDEVLSDTSSAYHVDFDSYPTDLRSLPIGILGKDSTDLAAVQFIMEADFFDNITGSADRDSIKDFAGEHFIFYTDPDTTLYSSLTDLGKHAQLTNRIVHNAASILQDSVKIIIIASDSAATYGLAAIESLLAASGTSVKVLGMDRSLAELTVRSYNSLREDNLLAFRISGQSLVSNVDEVYPPLPDSILFIPAIPQADSLQTENLLEAENVQVQDSTGRD